MALLPFPVPKILRQLWFTVFFVAAISLANMVFLLAMPLQLVGDWYNRVANFVLRSSWCFFPWIFEREAEGRVFVYGTAPPRQIQRLLLLVNHVEAPDWSIVFWLATAVGRLDAIRVFAKKALFYVPLIGSGMRAMGTVFLSRQWERDIQEVKRTFAHLRSSGKPYWLMSHAEGSRVTPAKLAEAQQFAVKRGLVKPQHVLLPRVKGFVATVAGLRGSLEAVLDATLCWEQSPASLPLYFLGFNRSPPRVHVLLRLYPVAELPQDDDGLSKWLYARWAEKDACIDTFKRTGSFGVGKALPVKLPMEDLSRNVYGWHAAVFTAFALLLVYRFVL